ncbi:F-box protein SKIP28 [Quercus suber]|nr:F-box protein SKIP28-like [Quercus suber]POF03539.1 f-box protein skip28 [Quercus suber]
MEISHVVEDNRNEDMQNSQTLLSSKSCVSSQNEYTQEVEPGPPHESLFLVLAYLPLFELLAMSEVCMSLRDAVHNDVLLWLNIIVERPLSSRLSDGILMKITSKASGRLKTLVLINCEKITDDGLQPVIRKNPHINKLFLPECTGLTPEGVIRAVKTLSENHHGLESLRIHGIYNIKKDHLDTIRSYFQMKLPQQEHQRQQPILFHHRNSPKFRNEESNPMIDIDVDICPKCNNVSMVYDCPRETCKKKSCKACNLCIPRCEECGECIIESEELEATACGDNLCSNCWLQLPKCNFCNQPYCKLHINHQHRFSGSTGFVCDACHVKFVAMLGACYC